MLMSMRTLFQKELLRLREQIFQKNRLGEAYKPDDSEIFTEEGWLESIVGKDEGMDEATMRKKITQEIMDQLSAKFAEDRKKLEAQMKV